MNMIAGNYLQHRVTASWLAEQLNLPLSSVSGTDIEITHICSLDQPADHGLAFSNQTQLQTTHQLVVIGDARLASETVSVLVTDRPRLAFALATQVLDEKIGFASATEPPDIHPSVKLGRYVVIGNNVSIGEGTVIGHHVVIEDRVKIGKHCQINAGAVIGGGDFGFERDETGRPIKIKHVGSVVIGDYVQIGSQATVSRATIGTTILEDYVKVDDHVYVSHNCHLGTNTIVTGGAILGGSTRYGEATWVGINATIRQKLTVGDRALVGMGAVVVKPVEEKQTVVGNPAKPLP